MTLIFLVIALIFNIGAQILLKHSIAGIRFDTINYNSIIKLFAIPQIWAGALLYGASFLFYIMALSRGELSKISPVSQALTTVGIVLISVLLFNEPVTLMKLIGLAFLIVGTIIIFQ